MEIELLPHQEQALLSEKKFVALAIGLGGGKTWTGVHWVLNRSLDSPQARGFIGANTFSQLQNSTLTAVFNELQRVGIDWSYNKSSGMLNILGKEWLCKSMDNYDVLRGIEVGEIWLDECAYSKEEAFKVILGRLRDKRGKLQMLLTSTPKGYNWFYHYMHPDGTKFDPEMVEMIRGTSKDNVFLPEGYLETLEKQYDPKLLKQELGGEFVNISSGNVYYAFNRACVTKVDYRKGFPIWVGMDFNPHRMSAVLCQIVGNRLHVFDEVYDTNRGANTLRMAEILKSKYGSKLNIVPDSTGVKATSNANRSDIQILKDAGFKVSVSPNPFRVDRYAAVNTAFHRDLVSIDESCKNLISDLDAVCYRADSDQVDTSDPNHGHMTDAFGYVLYRTINPLYNSHKKVSSQPRT